MAYRNPRLSHVRITDGRGNLLLKGNSYNANLTDFGDHIEVDIEVDDVVEANPSAIRCLADRRPVVGTVVRAMQQPDGTYAYEDVERTRAIMNAVNAPLSITEETVRAALASKFRQGTVWAVSRQQELLRAFVNVENPQNADRILRDFENQFPAISKWRKQIADKLFRVSVDKNHRGYLGSCVDGRRTTHYFDLEDQW